jgi:hypothetical protein
VVLTRTIAHPESLGRPAPLFCEFLVEPIRIVLETRFSISYVQVGREEAVQGIVAIAIIAVIIRQVIVTVTGVIVTIGNPG